jgi:hypothetical protein
MNSLPPSVYIWAGIPNLQNYSLKMASATVSAFLFWIEVTTAYLLNASDFGSLFVLDNEVVFKQGHLESAHRFAVKMSEFF